MKCNKIFILTVTTNILYLADKGLPLSISSPVAGNHHDLYQIETSLSELFEPLTKAGIHLDGLFVNTDAGFDGKLFREAYLSEGIFPNVDFNYRNGGNNEELYILDE